MARNLDPGLGSRAGLLSVEVETKEFNRRINKFRRQCKLSTEVIIRRVAMELLRRILVKNPVATGRSRAGWYSATVGLGLPWTDEGDSPSNITRGKTEGRFHNNLKHPMDKYVLIINNVYYVLHLEYGSSDQAPAGMVRVSIREMMGIVPKEIQDAYVANWKGKNLTLSKVKFTP